MRNESRCPRYPIPGDVPVVFYVIVRKPISADYSGNYFTVRITVSR